MAKFIPQKSHVAYLDAKMPYWKLYVYKYMHTDTHTHTHRDILQVEKGIKLISYIRVYVYNYICACGEREIGERDTWERPPNFPQHGMGWRKSLKCCPSICDN